jgi:hypothetical protein
MPVNIQIPENLIKDFQKYGNNIARNIATQVRDALTEEYNYSVQQFYGSYDPQQYKRQYSLYNTGKKYYRNPHGTRVHGGVEIFSDKMGEHHDSNEYVLDISLKGIHGEPSIAVTPPWILDHMLTYRLLLFNSIDVNDGGIGSTAIAKAKSNSYTILKFK